MVTRFGRYEVKRELGRGGMGTVYLAHDPRFDRDVALKVMPPGCLQDPTFGERFEREARLIARLEHGAIVPVHDYGEDNHLPFLVMRLMTGGSLADRLQEGPLPLDQAIAVTQRICEALDKAHARNIIHRDLKPANILFDEDGAPFLADFGIARVVEATQTMTVIGTPQYMAPEQAHGRPVDARTDVYQMGVVLFEMLTGKVPFDATTPAALLHQHAYAPIPSPRDFKADLPPGCETVIQKALAKDPDERYPTALALAEAVAGLKDGARVAAPVERPARSGRNAAGGTAATGVARPEDGRAGRRRIPAWGWVLGGVLALLAVAAAVVLPLLNSDREGAAEGAATAVAAADLVPSRTPVATPSGTSAPSPVPTATRTPAPSNTARPTNTATRTSAPTSTSTRLATPTPVRTATGAPASPTPVAATASVVAGRVAETDVVYHDGFEVADGSAVYVQGTTPWLDLLARIGGTWYGPERWPDDGINALPLPAGYVWRASGAFAANPNGEAWWTGAGTEGRAWLSAGGVTVAEVALKITFRGTSGGDGDKPPPTPGGTAIPTSGPTAHPSETASP